VLGADPQRAGRAWRARIGIVLQLAADVPELTVAEMVGHFAGFYPSPRRPAEVVDLVGLTSQGRTRIHALSGGQLRRLDVALGLIGGPELLFLDEPTTGFDPAATVRLGYDPDAIWLEVSDDGAGFDPARVSGGYGLHGMRTRVAEAGGTLTVRTSPGAGTRVSAMVPA
jgi:ABC transporter